MGEQKQQNKKQTFPWVDFAPDTQRLVVLAEESESGGL